MGFDGLRDRVPGGHEHDRLRGAGVDGGQQSSFLQGGVAMR